MAQSEQNQSLAALAHVCEQLSEVVTTSPIEQMEQQLNSQRQQTQDNIEWLDEALDLLGSLSDAQNGQQLSQLIENVENFVSKSSNDVYDKSYSHNHLSKNN